MSASPETLQHGLQHGSSRSGSCFLCGSTNDPIVVSEDGYVGRASSCGVVYIDPVPAPGVVQPAEDHHLETYYSLPAKVRLDFVARCQPGGSLLEVGCGGGEFLALARRRGYKVAAVEPNPEAALVAEGRGIEVERALVEESTLREGSFDVVFHVDLLSHFPDPVKALRKMSALVRPDGLVCFEVGVPALARKWYRCRIGYPQHLWLYSENAIHTLLAQSGLRVEAVQRFGLLASTLLSTVGNLTVRNRISRPTNKGGRSARATGFYRAYSWLQYILRYRIGKYMPAVGSYTMLVAARRVEADPV
jgi:SAM-dependent methyltransferase